LWAGDRDQCHNTRRQGTGWTPQLTARSPFPTRESNPARAV
jgi:hypothetical protein